MWRGLRIQLSPPSRVSWSSTWPGTPPGSFGNSPTVHAAILEEDGARWCFAFPLTKPDPMASLEKPIFVPGLGCHIQTQGAVTLPPLGTPDLREGQQEVWVQTCSKTWPTTLPHRQSWQPRHAPSHGTTTAPALTARRDHRAVGNVLGLQGAQIMLVTSTTSVGCHPLLAAEPQHHLRHHRALGWWWFSLVPGLVWFMPRFCVQISTTKARRWPSNVQEC